MPRAAPMHASLALLPLLMLPACGPQVQADRLIERPPPPAAMLACLPEPSVPQRLEADADLFGWVEDVRQAGADCREKVAALRGLLLPAAR